MQQAHGRLAAWSPRLAGWLEARFNPRVATGLPLTLLLAAAAYTVMLMFDLVEEVVEGEEAQAMDDMVNEALAPLRSDVVVLVFRFITEFGNNSTLSAVALVATGFLWAHRRYADIGPMWLCIVGTQLVTWGGKYGFGRERPDFLVDAVAHSPSFPSAHSAGSMAVYGFVAFAIARPLASPTHRYHLFAGCVTVVGLVAFSRMLLSVHFLTDVAAGLLVGLFWLLISICLREWLVQRLPAGARPREGEL